MTTKAQELARAITDELQQDLGEYWPNCHGAVSNRIASTIAPVLAAQEEEIEIRREEIERLRRQLVEYVTRDLLHVNCLTRERDEARTERDALRERVTELEAALDLTVTYYRRRVWLNHGCDPRLAYGDDGEMQCSARGCPVIDFRRTSVQEIERRLYESKLAKAVPQHVCGLSGYNGMLDPPCPGCEALRNVCMTFKPCEAIPREFFCPGLDACHDCGHSRAAHASTKEEQHRERDGD